MPPKSQKKSGKSKKRKKGSSDEEAEPARLGSERQRTLRARREAVSAENDPASFEVDLESLPVEEIKIEGDSLSNVLHPKRYKQCQSVLYQHACCRAVCIRNQNRTIYYYDHMPTSEIIANIIHIHSLKCRNFQMISPNQVAIKNIVRTVSTWSSIGLKDDIAGSGWHDSLIVVQEIKQDSIPPIELVCFFLLP